VFNGLLEKLLDYQDLDLAFLATRYLITNHLSRGSLVTATHPMGAPCSCEEAACGVKACRGRNPLVSAAS